MRQLRDRERLSAVLENIFRQMTKDYSGNWGMDINQILLAEQLKLTRLEREEENDVE